MRIEWLSTEPSPRSGMNAAGGWKLHAINIDDDASWMGIGPRKAVCGLRPAYGWGCDLFIKDKCISCRLSLGETVTDGRMRYRRPGEGRTTLADMTKLRTTRNT